MVFVAVLLAALSGCASDQIPEEPSGKNVTDDLQQNAEEPSGQPPAEEDASAELQFDAMELDIDRGSMYIREGDAFSFALEDGKELDYEIVDNVLSVSQHHDQKAVLTLPEGGTYTSLLLTVGEGHVYVECPVSLQELELRVSRGEVTFSEVSVTDSSTIEVSQGSAFLTGDLGPSVTACSKEGHLSMEVASAQEEYNFEVELSTGNIRLGTEDYHGLSVTKSIDNGAERSMKLVCSRGDLSVAFDR